ncbi:MAG TPA: helix-turn-helix transcriptional regulator [Solirubrobacteraceae bacterium]|jgi:transcriptional regulator with XRE-family HTH domain|nr:helix-turn-helix transcriptional regulator [Solirubrobacteraceae bacterium]
MLIAIDSIHDLTATVRGRRHSLGMTQEQLAARMRVSRQWVSQFERGKRTVELGLALRLLDALDLGLRLETDPADNAPAPTASSTIDLDRLLADYRNRDQ